MFLFLLDAVHNRLGSSNGKFISFVDTCRSVNQYRSGLPSSSRYGMSTCRLLWIAMCSLLVKYAANCVISVMLGKVPILFNGPRHAIFFALGFTLIWLSPGDVAHQSLMTSRAVKLMVDMGGGLYKMRKVIFAVEAAAATRGSFGYAVFLAVLSVDGTSLMRRLLHFVEARLLAHPQRRKRTLSRALNLCLNAGSCGARQTLLSTVLPLSVVTALLWVAASSEWDRGITDDSFLGLRAALLALFIWRAGAFHEFAYVHLESGRIACSGEMDGNGAATQGASGPDDPKLLNGADKKTS